MLAPHTWSSPSTVIWPILHFCNHSDWCGIDLWPSTPHLWMWLIVFYNAQEAISTAGEFNELVWIYNPPASLLDFLLQCFKLTDASIWCAFGLNGVLNCIHLFIHKFCSFVRIINTLYNGNTTTKTKNGIILDWNFPFNPLVLFINFWK